MRPRRPGRGSQPRPFGISDWVPIASQMGINQEDQLVGRQHDREDIFPDENNSSYRYMKSSSGKKFTRKLDWISDILRITGSRQAVFVIL
jgi:hypothetical protein